MKASHSIFWLLAFALAASFSIGALKSKPAPDFPDDGALLDVSGWSFRKSVEVIRPGAQQLELDLDVLSRAQPHFEDLRLMRSGEQVPYIIDHTTVQRALTPAVTNDTHDPKLSRWVLKLPNATLPIIRLACTSRTSLFQRDMTAFEELRDERGEKYERSLGRASWVQRPGTAKKELALTLDSAPQSDTIILETHNGDNPPVELENFRLFYPATRLLFRAKADDALWLYYGNSEASAPRYDLTLVANELLAADKATASLGKEERLNKATYRIVNAGKGGVLFWGILALVVVALLVVIARLLPKSDASHSPNSK